MVSFLRIVPASTLIVAIGALVGVSITLSKIATNAGTPALTALFWQLLVATIVLMAMGLASGKRLQLTPQYLFYYLGAGLLGISLPGFVGYTVLGKVSVSIYSVLITLSPIFTFIVSSVVERKILPLHRLLGILVGLIGISMITTTGLDLADTGFLWIGVAILGPLFLALGNVFRSKAYPSSGNPTMMATGALLSQLLLVWPVLFLIGEPSGVEPTSSPAQLAMIGVGLVTAFSYLLTFEVQSRADGVSFAQVGYFATLFGIAFGALIFGEVIAPSLVFSLAILFLGLAISNGHLNPRQLYARLTGEKAC
ncbi:MAG TPA: EamA/RhaT family transporter [Rhizobiales bacterium]|nr:EamA/RhaT family transporter [Hyphomicrobiales bacterium]